ncbi:DUF305 domain-containing protein [Microseira wollei]|uniref:DUF305 domain-containing protein n=1 Tax=Microseira wollei NIES-4236 TaxID=2530354 RepID=A0AAV3XFH3_9CYAN|nr:DUF305 domain-containing protein [Microseira wollei]GET41134.1 hypothetical protein MiSe_59460 [Microseira wollei NIES-4236]
MKSFVTGIVIVSTLFLAQSCSSKSTSQNPSQVTTPNATIAGNKVEEHPGHGSSGNHSMAINLGPADADYDLRFIDAMTPHHQGAVLMAQEVQQKSKRPEMKQLADNIIKAQNQEIEQMKQWRNNWYPPAGNQPMAYDAKMGQTVAMSPEQMQSMMMSQDLGSADETFDQRFIDAMIPHHEAALTMAQDALKKTKRPEIKKLAQEIVTSQQKEIDQMQQWRKAWYKQ